MGTTRAASTSRREPWIWTTRWSASSSWTRLRWTLLDELALSPPFGFQAVLAYALKLRLAEKWAAMDGAEGLRIAAGLADRALEGATL